MVFKGKLKIVKNAIKPHSLTLESSIYLFIIFNKNLSKACSALGSMLVVGTEYEQNRIGRCHRGAQFYWGGQTIKQQKNSARKEINSGGGREKER